jgi:class 3 adenylate cyclase/streptogramin lyase
VPSARPSFRNGEEDGDGLANHDAHLPFGDTSPGAASPPMHALTCFSTALPGRTASHKLSSMPRKTEAPKRRLTTVMFTDIVGSTGLAFELGDRRWRQLLARHHAVVRRALRRHGGRELDTAGDGFFATFEQPGRAIACAVELTGSLRNLGIEIRAGINMGEVEAVGPKVGGIAVHVGSRVMSLAGPGEVWVSRTVRDLMAGSDVRFEDRGVHELKGVSGKWRLYSVLPPPAEPVPEETAEPLPGPKAWIADHLALVALISLVVVALPPALLLFLSPNEDDNGVFTTPAPNTVVRIDSESEDITRVSKVGTDPVAVTYGLGSVWVANFGGRTVQRVEPSSGDPDDPIGLTASGNPTGIVTGGGFVWVTGSIDGVVFKIDPRTRGTKEIHVGVGVQGIAFGEGAVWVTNGQSNEVLRIDPVSEGIDRIKLEEDGQPSGIAVGAGSVWVAEHLTGRVARIDPQALEVVGTIPLLRGRPDEVAFGGGYVWVTVGSDDSVVRIDPASGLPTMIDSVGNEPAGIAVDTSGVWVANALDGTVARIDPRRGEVVRAMRLGFQPQGVAAGEEGVWVTVSR